MSTEIPAVERERVNGAVLAESAEVATPAGRRGLSRRELGLLAAGVAVGAAVTLLSTRSARARLALGGRRNVIVSLPFSGITFGSSVKGGNRAKPASRRQQRAQRRAQRQVQRAFLQMVERRTRRPGRFARFTRRAA